AKVDVTFVIGQAPRGTLEGPSPALAADKADFGSTRVQRWFGRTWP
ncbi:MAG: sulfide:quinone oxidoreductase, partial [Ilumatobacteraceae bacterium]